jgi:hypothetical protein
LQADIHEASAGEVGVSENRCHLNQPSVLRKADDTTQAFQIQQVRYFALLPDIAMLADYFSRPLT